MHTYIYIYIYKHSHTHKMYTYTRLSVCMKTLKKFYFFDKNLISFIVCFSVVFFEHLAFNFYNNEKKNILKKEL